MMKCTSIIFNSIRPNNLNLKISEKNNIEKLLPLLQLNIIKLQLEGITHEIFSGIRTCSIRIQ